MSVLPVLTALTGANSLLIVSNSEHGSDSSGFGVPAASHFVRRTATAAEHTIQRTRVYAPLCAPCPRVCLILILAGALSPCACLNFVRLQQTYRPTLCWIGHNTLAHAVQ